MHSVAVGEGSGPRWGWNGDVEKPTFTPSVLAQWDQWEPSPTTDDLSEKIKRGEIKQVQVHKVCHTFITDGRVQFLNDCTHQYAGQILELPDLPEHAQ